MRYLPIVLGLSLLACDKQEEPLEQEKSPEELTLQEKAKRSLDDIGNSLKDKIDSVQNDLKGLVDKTGSISEEKIRAILADLDAAEPALQEAGFELRQVAAEVGLNPGVIVYFRQNEAVSEDKQKELVEKYKDSKTTSILLKSLFYVYGVEFGSYQIREAILYIEALPKLRVLLEKKGRSLEV